MTEKKPITLQDSLRAAVEANARRDPSTKRAMPTLSRPPHVAAPSAPKPAAPDPTPARVTLTDEERAVIDAALDEHHLDINSGGDGNTPGIYAAAASLLAAREAAVSAQIKADILAECEAAEPPCYGCWNAAQIAGGEQ